MSAAVGAGRISDACGEGGHGRVVRGFFPNSRQCRRLGDRRSARILNTISNTIDWKWWILAIRERHHEEH